LRVGGRLLEERRTLGEDVLSSRLVLRLFPLRGQRVVERGDVVGGDVGPRRREHLPRGFRPRRGEGWPGRIVLRGFPPVVEAGGGDVGGRAGAGKARKGVARGLGAPFSVAHVLKSEEQGLDGAPVLRPNGRGAGERVAVLADRLGVLPLAVESVGAGERL